MESTLAELTIDEPRESEPRESDEAEVPFNWDNLLPAVEQLARIRAQGGEFTTKGLNENTVSTSDHGKVAAEFKARGVIKAGHFPADYCVQEQAEDGGEIMNDTVELLLLRSPKTFKRIRLLPYPPKSPCGIWIRSRIDRKVIGPKDCDHCHGKTVHFQSLKNAWGQSKLCQKLVQDLKENAGNMASVNRVVRFDLRSNTDEGPTHIKVIAQDRQYCKHWKESLSSYGITVVEHPEGFLYVHEDTFVMATSQLDRSYRDWALDKTCKVGDPAAMLCPPEEEVKDPKPGSRASSSQVGRWTKVCEDMGLALPLDDDYIPPDETELKRLFGHGIGKSGGQKLYWRPKVKGPNQVQE